MPLFVTTAEFVCHLEKMFRDAEKSIVIISPYIKISQRIRSILLEKTSNDVDVKIVFREDFDLCDIKASLFKRNNLHAKCFFTEKAALIGSMNLYDYSQTNNDEMGFFLTKEESPGLYNTIEKEAIRLCTPFLSQEKRALRYQNNKKSIEIGKQYAKDEISVYFSFKDNYPCGIKETTYGDIVLFHNSNSNKYKHEEKDGIIYYMGQNTGTEVQSLKFGNKALHDSFTMGKGRIFLFRDNIFQGECVVCMPPFQKSGKWIFPLKLTSGS